MHTLFMNCASNGSHTFTYLVKSNYIQNSTCLILLLKSGDGSLKCV